MAIKINPLTLHRIHKFGEIRIVACVLSCVALAIGVAAEYLDFRVALDNLNSSQWDVRITVYRTLVCVLQLLPFIFLTLVLFKARNRAAHVLVALSLCALICSVFVELYTRGYFFGETFAPDADLILLGACVLAAAIIIPFGAKPALAAIAPLGYALYREISLIAGGAGWTAALLTAIASALFFTAAILFCVNEFAQLYRKPTPQDEQIDKYLEHFIEYAFSDCMVGYDESFWDE